MFNERGADESEGDARASSGRADSAIDRALTEGVPAGVLAAAASAGALIGFGIREGAPARYLAAAGQRLLGVPAFVTPDRGFGPAALLGAAQHLVVVLGWALLHALLVGRLHGRARVAATVAFGIVLCLLDGFLPALVRLAGGAPTLPQRAFAVLLLVAALPIGARFTDSRRM